MKMLAKCMNAEELAREVLSVYGIKSDKLLATMRDRSSVNNSAMNTIIRLLLILVALPTH